MPSEQGEPRLLLRDEHDNASPAWSVDGRRIAFSSDRAGSSGLWEIEVASGRLQQLIPNVSQTGEGPKLVIGSHGKLAYTESSHEVDLLLAGGRHWHGTAADFSHTKARLRQKLAKPTGFSRLLPPVSSGALANY